MARPDRISMAFMKGRQVAAPAAPTNLTLGAVTVTTQDISWDAVTDATGYRIYFRTPSGSGAYTLFGTVTLPFSSVTGLGEASVDFYVTAVGPGGESVPSNVVTRIAFAALNRYVAYWKCNEAAAANNLTDTSANALTGIVTGAPAVAAGKVNGCRTFNGTTQYAGLADGGVISRNGKTWSINFWVRPTGISVFQLAISKDDNVLNREFAIGIRGDNNHFYVNINSQFAVLESTTVAASGTWYNVCLTFTTGTKAIALYVNGVSEATGNAAAEISSTTANFSFACNNSEGVINAPLAGDLDNILLYDDLLTATEITKLFNANAGYVPPP